MPTGGPFAAPHRPRLAIPVTYQFSVRYLVQTGMLRGLADVLQPVVLLGWEDPDLVALLEAEGAEVAPLPEARFGADYLRHRRLVDVAHRRRLGSPSGPIDERRRDAVFSGTPLLKRRVRRAVMTARATWPGASERIFAEERRLLDTDTNVADVAAALAPLGLDAVLSVTPYHRAEELVMRVAERNGMPLVASIISFDNVTTRGWFSSRYDRYLVWNRHNRDELLRSVPGLTADDVVVCGAPQFDFYARPGWVWDETTWRDRVGLPPDRPVVLFGGGPEVIVPHEPHLLGQIDDAITRGEIPGEPLVLFRRHPMERPERWAPVLAACRNVVADEPWAVRKGSPEHSSGTNEDIQRLASTLAHSAVHVNCSSTMTVDGAYFDRPQVGPAYDDRPGRPADRLVRELYEREHWLPIASSGGMVIARDRDEMVRAIAAGLADPGARADGRARLVTEIITSTDGRATERTVDAVAEALGIAS